MTVSVVFAIAGVIALLFGIIGGGIKAKEIEIPFLPVRARIVTIIVGLALISVTVWLENNKALIDNPASTPQTQTVSLSETPPVNPNITNNSTPNTAINATTVQSATGGELERLYLKFNEAKTWKLVFQEPFDNNNNNWDLWNVEDDWKTETMKIDRGVFNWKLEIKKPDLYYDEIAPITSYADFYYSARVKRIGKATEEQVNQAGWGIIFRRQGDKFYFLGLNDLQEYSLWFHDNTGWTDLVGNTKSSLVNIETYNELAVIADGNEITFFINGVPVKAISDSTLSEGNIGFYASLNYINDEVSFEFDDVEIRQKP